jgi:hypothetical protein
MYAEVKNAIDKLSQQEDVVTYLTDRGFDNLLNNGGRLRSAGCPVARWLQSETGYSDITVACDYVGTNVQLISELPDNINRAIQHFDNLTYDGDVW